MKWLLIGLGLLALAGCNDSKQAICVDATTHHRVAAGDCRQQGTDPATVFLWYYLYSQMLTPPVGSYVSPSVGYAAPPSYSTSPGYSEEEPEATDEAPTYSGNLEEAPEATAAPEEESPEFQEPEETPSYTDEPESFSSPGGEE